MKRALFAAALAASLPAAPAHAGAALFGYDDVYRVVALQSPQIAPDGSRVLVVVRGVDRERDRYTRRLDVIDVATAARRTVALGVENFASPRWSPSADRIAYLSGGAVWVAGADGTAPHRVTDAAFDVVQFAWRPDGAALAFIAIDRAPPASGDARFLDAYEVGNDAALAAGAQRPAHVWVQPLDGGAARALGPHDGSAASGDAESTLSWSPDGATLAYVHVPTNVTNDSTGSRIRLVDVASGRDRWFGPLREVRDPLFSPDGAQLAYVYGAGPSQLAPPELFVATPSGGAARNRTHALDRTVRDIAWQPRAQTLWFTANSATRHVLYHVSGDAAPHAVPLGALSVGSGLTGAIAADGTVAFVGQSSQGPDELYVLPPGDGPPKRLTSYNDGVAGLALAATSRVTYHTGLGIDGDAVLTRPPGFTAGRRYPLVVVLHGGPTSSATETFDPLGQLLAARGWLVLEPNYRGSNNLGARYQRAVGGDKLRGPGADVDAALAAVRTLGIVDERRLAVSGWSYGAGLTLWMIEQRHDWRAAVAGAAVTDIAVDYATADDIDADRTLLGGSPLVGPGRALAASMSPITYVDRVRTPLLLMTCRGDTRVSPAGVYEFFHALRDLHRDVRLVAYPVDGHMPGDPVRRTDVYRRWVGFIAERFGS